MSKFTLSFIETCIEKNDPKSLFKQFHVFDKIAVNINDFQTEWGLPLEPHGCQIAHKLRGSIMTAESWHDRKAHECVKMEFETTKMWINFIKEIGPELSSVFSKIKRVLYSD